MAKIAKLPERRWRDARKLRLEALKTDPAAFGSSYEEEKVLLADEWRRRMKNTLFALAEGKPVGMITRAFSGRAKTRHVAAVYGFYVTPKSRGMGVGKLLLDAALRDIRDDKKIVKVQLSVNPEFRAALALYRRAGFEVTGRARNELRVGGEYFDLLNMEKTIREPLGTKSGRRTSSTP